MRAALLGVLAASVVLLLVAEARRSTRLAWATKPVASAAFVALGIDRGADPGVLAALVLAAVGDVLLLHPRGFRAGLVAFLLAHVAYAATFTARGLDPAWTAGAAVVVAAASALVLRRLFPHVPPALRVPVVAYVVVIGAMVAAATGTRAPAIAAAAAAFWLSDLLVTHHRFVRPAVADRIVGLPLYYGAQAVFALAT